MRSFLEDIGGLYNPTLRFAFTNITEEDFTSYWGGVPIIVKPRETIEISNTTPIPGAGHALALKMTGELVDKIMIGNIKLDEAAKKDPYYRSPEGSSLGVPAARKIWEDQILRQLAPDEESPSIQVMRKQMMEEIKTGTSAQVSKEPVKGPGSLEEFADLTAKTPQETKPPVKVKKLGRPRKIKLDEASLSNPA
jgi:hypothetical protein